MPQKKELHISISPTGEVSVQVKCIAGMKCVDETKFLEEALGNEIESRELTSDYYQSQVGTGVTNRTGG
jgi:hypothetical protein